MVVLHPDKYGLISEIMLEMEKRKFTTREAEDFPEQLKRAIKRNSERFEEEKPFAVYKG